MVMKIWEFSHKNSYNSSYIRDIDENLAQSSVFEVSPFNGVIEIYPKSILVVTITKNWEF